MGGLNVLFLFLVTIPLRSLTCHVKQYKDNPFLHYVLLKYRSSKRATLEQRIVGNACKSGLRLAFTFSCIQLEDQPAEPHAPFDI